MRVNVNIDGLVTRFDLVRAEVKDGKPMYGLSFSFSRPPTVRGVAFPIDSPPENALLPQPDDYYSYVITFWSHNLNHLRDLLAHTLGQLAYVLDEAKKNPPQP